jgi:hypothetical protein
MDPGAYFVLKTFVLQRVEVYPGAYHLVFITLEHQKAVVHIIVLIMLVHQRIVVHPGS